MQRQTNALRLKPKIATGPPDKFTYALSAYTAERRKEGWFVGRSVPDFAGGKSKWAGPFQTIETAMLSIARHLATELADRHTRSVEWHKLGPSHPLCGFKPTTRLKVR